MTKISRIIALGASNLTRGFHTVVSSARAAWGPEVQIFAAFGHGRSYGASSRVLVRTLPGILKSGLWETLSSLSRVPTRALVTDVGNDILYGFPAGKIVGWIDEILSRLQDGTRDIILTDLPMESLKKLSTVKYLFFRSILFPFSHLSLSQVLHEAAEVNEGLKKLSIVHDVKLFRLDPEWYGFDPIHIRPSLWREAWRQILNTPSSISGGSSVFEGIRLYFMAPESRRICGIEQNTLQTGITLPAGGQIFLY